MKIFQRKTVYVFMGSFLIFLFFLVTPIGFYVFAEEVDLTDPTTWPTDDEPSSDSGSGEESESNTDLERLRRVGGQAGFETESGTALSETGNREDVAKSAVFLLALPFIRILQVIYGFLATLLVILIIKAGYTWLTSQGNEEKVTKAKNTLSQAFIGFFLLMASALIIYFVLLVLGQVETSIISTGAGDLR